MREKVDPGNWELHLQGTSKIKLIDDSSAQENLLVMVVVSLMLLVVQLMVVLPLFRLQLLVKHEVVLDYSILI